MSSKDVYFKLDAMPPYSGIVFLEDYKTVPVVVQPYIEVKVPNPLPITVTDKPGITDNPPAIIAIVALAVSIFSILLNLFLLRKARRRAVIDEFWLQKVIYPDVIQPLLEYLKATIKNMPSSKKKNTRTSIEKYYLKFQGEMGDHSKNLNMFGLIDKKLFRALNQSFEIIEDYMAEYTHLLILGPSQELNDAHVNLVNALENYQLNLISNMKKYQDKL